MSWNPFWKDSSTAPAAAAKAAPVPVKPIQVARNARYERLKDWLRANEIALADKTLSDDARLSHHALALYPAAKGGCLATGTGCFAGTDPKAPVYLLGDTHGDFDSFVAIVGAILDIARQHGEKTPVLYLLGDVVDRNGEGCMLECALVLAILQKALPEEFSDFNDIRLGIVKGDHDVGLLYPGQYDATARFFALVSPADYCDWLNERLDAGGGEDATKIGRAWIRLMEECPAAVFLEATGTLLAHGGVPRDDLQKRLAGGEPYLLQSEAFALDFEWCRMVDVKKKLLNRSSKTSEIGGLEFDSFCKIVFPDPDGCGTRVRRFVFAHQHPAKGFEQYTKYFDGYEAVCISSFRADDVFGGPSMPHFCRLENAAGKDHASGRLEVYCVDLSSVSDAPPESPAGGVSELSREDVPAAGTVVAKVADDGNSFPAPNGGESSSPHVEETHGSTVCSSSGNAASDACTAPQAPAAPTDDAEVKADPPVSREDASPSGADHATGAGDETGLPGPNGEVPSAPKVEVSPSSMDCASSGNASSDACTAPQAPATSTDNTNVKTEAPAAMGTE